MPHPVTPETLSRLKLAVAALGCVGLYLEARLGRRLSARLKAAVGVLLAMAAVACYFELFQLPFGRYYHRWEMYHYVVG
jgi:hypothetical protein